uniref:Uncharacterized protein n=1 Tax=Ditylenchus dipsaci TaxID=166011 RepID=A0A915D498_9BILA
METRNNMLLKSLLISIIFLCLFTSITSSTPELAKEAKSDIKTEAPDATSTKLNEPAKSAATPKVITNLTTSHLKASPTATPLSVSAITIKALVPTQNNTNQKPQVDRKGKENENNSEEVPEEEEKEAEAEKENVKEVKSKSAEKPAVTDEVVSENKPKPQVVKAPVEPKRQDLLRASASDIDQSTGHAFVYILAFGVLLFVVYFLVHNKNKILGLLLEGRSGRRGSVGRRAGGNARYRRLSTADADSKSSSCAVDVDSEQRNYVS